MSRTLPPSRRLPEPPRDLVQLALAARAPDDRLRLARAALAREDDLDRDTEFLLLRQLYVGHLERGENGRALLATRRMANVGVLQDVAHHDASRAYAAKGDLAAAIAAQTEAVAAAPRERKSFHLWGLATLEHFAGDARAAMASLARAIRFGGADRALLRAHLAWVRLDAGLATPGLADIVADLTRSPASEGYGRFLLGMIAHELGDEKRAAAHLRAFLRRNALIDAAKAITLREELRRARAVVARDLS